MSKLQSAIDQIVFARGYTLDVLKETPMDEWFRIPPAGVSHVAWQVGHLAVAQYRMVLWRTRGLQPGDEALVSKEFVGQFGYDSVPVADSTKYPTPEEIRQVLDRVHEQVLRELAGFSESAMDEPVVHPHPFAKTKEWALIWCAHHEMLHAGQIGLLRRQLGHAPLR